MVWYKLRMPCPITGCSNQTRIFSWVCATDSNTMFVSEQGRLSCSTGSHNYQIVKWKFDCGDRVGRHRNTHFLYADFEGFVHAMAIGLPLLPEAGAIWVKQLVDEIEKQFKH